MAFDSTPWFVGGGAQHSPEIARALAYAATGGAEGVVGATDLKVTQLPTPGTSVRLSAGAAIMLNRSAGAGGSSAFGSTQSYVGRAPTATDIAVDPTTSAGGRTDLVVVRVEDPQYAPWTAPADPVTATYFRPFIVKGVPAATKTAAELNLGYPAVALAKITLPASTATVTNSHITDLRRIARPRSERRLIPVYQSGNSALNQAAGVWQNWPLVASLNLEVPDWATVLRAKLDIGGVQQLVGSIQGAIRLNFQGTYTQQVGYDFNWTGTPARHTLIQGGEIPITDAQRAAGVANLKSEGMRSGTWVSGATLQADPWTTGFFDVEFTERPL